MQKYQVINMFTNEIIGENLSYCEAVDLKMNKVFSDRYRVFPQFSKNERGETITQLPDDYVQNNEYAVIFENSKTPCFIIMAESLIDALRILSTKSGMAQNIISQEKAISIRKV